MKVIAIVSLCLTLLGSAGCELISKPQQGKKVNEVWETSNKAFKIRITSYAEENGGFVPGAYYVFQSASVDSAKWQEVLTIRNDDPVPIPKDQVRFMNDAIAYFFMVYKYAVTTDGGRTWFVGNIVTDLPNWQQNRPSIKDIRIAPDGSGTMELSSSTNQEARPLYTRDYGRHWGTE